VSNGGGLLSPSEVQELLPIIPSFSGKKEGGADSIVGASVDGVEGMGEDGLGSRGTPDDPFAIISCVTRSMLVFSAPELLAALAACLRCSDLVVRTVCCVAMSCSTPAAVVFPTVLSWGGEETGKGLPIRVSFSNSSASEGYCEESTAGGGSHRTAAPATPAASHSRAPTSMPWSVPVRPSSSVPTVTPARGKGKGKGKGRSGGARVSRMAVKRMLRKRLQTALDERKAVTAAMRTMVNAVQATDSLLGVTMPMKGESSSTLLAALPGPAVSRLVHALTLVCASPYPLRAWAGMVADLVSDVGVGALPRGWKLEDVDDTVARACTFGTEVASVARSLLRALWTAHPQWHTRVERVIGATFIAIVVGTPAPGAPTPTGVQTVAEFAERVAAFGDPQEAGSLAAGILSHIKGSISSSRQLTFVIE
jgi:hypothetical protein